MSERTNKNDLIAFAGPTLDLILRLKAGIVQPSNDWRPEIIRCSKILRNAPSVTGLARKSFRWQNLRWLRLLTNGLNQQFSAQSRVGKKSFAA